MDILGQLKTYENKVLRYPGHFEWLRAYKELGLFKEEPVLVGEQLVKPRDLYHTLLEPKIFTENPRDICVIRAVGIGTRDSKPARVIVDMVDEYDPYTGFTGMERLTGWHCAIMMKFMADKRVRSGVIPVELAVQASDFMVEFERRGIPHTIKWESA